jgi:hypothetical protein
MGSPKAVLPLRGLPVESTAGCAQGPQVMVAPLHGTVRLMADPSARTIENNQKSVNVENLRRIGKPIFRCLFLFWCLASTSIACFPFTVKLLLSLEEP